MPDVSVVVPTFNRAAFIEASVTSLLTDAVDVEVLVVDDGSVDDTAVRLERLGDPRVRVLVRAHAGIAAARNAGVAASRGRHVAFHDSDDRALPGRLARPVAHLDAHPDVAFVVQNGRMAAREGAAAGAPWLAPATVRALRGRPLGVADVFRWNLGQLQGMCFRRTALERVGPLDGTFRILDDLDLVLRVAVRFAGVFLDETAFVYHPGGDSVSRDRHQIHEEAIALAEKLVREHPEALRAIGPGVFRRRQARRWARLAEARHRRGDLAAACAAMASACRLTPCDVRLRLRARRLRRAT
jgi:glycosyltransferase involved in cell wall biosynthesis